MLRKWLNWNLEMAETRTPRDLVSREKEVREVYVPPNNLPDPTPEPGVAYRWIATHVLGQAVPTNVSLKLREGWTPVKAEDHPELMLFGASAGGNVEIGGLMLCKMSSAKARSRDEYYQKSAASQMSSVDNNFMRENDPRMPLFSDRKSTVSFGKNL